LKPLKGYTNTVWYILVWPGVPFDRKWSRNIAKQKCVHVIMCKPSQRHLTTTIICVLIHYYEQMAAILNRIGVSASQGEIILNTLVGNVVICWRGRDILCIFASQRRRPCENNMIYLAVTGSTVWPEIVPRHYQDNFLLKHRYCETQIK
jgi:hypothetical protein